MYKFLLYLKFVIDFLQSFVDKFDLPAFFQF